MPLVLSCKLQIINRDINNFSLLPKYNWSVKDKTTYCNVLDEVATSIESWPDDPVNILIQLIKEASVHHTFQSISKSTATNKYGYCVK